ncbi:MAG TPA: hypothetical protein VJM11_00225 [Nevskiaceae bacterium]|nr:hypothetical protein [Nevskiaceae bacterium]
MLMRLAAPAAPVTSVAPVERTRPLTIDAREVWDGDPQRRSREPRIEAHPGTERIVVPRSANVAIQAYRDCDAAPLAPLLQDVYA